MSDKQHWLSLWNQLFPENRLYEQSDIDEWDKSLDHMEPAANNDEIRAALTALSERRDVPKRGFGLRHVIGRINETRATWDSVGSCGLCKHGWIDCYEELPEQGFTWQDSRMAHSTVIPCTCKAGDAIQQKEGLTQEQIQRFRKFQRKAERQARWLKQLDGEQVSEARTGYRDVQEGDEL